MSVMDISEAVSLLKFYVPAAASWIALRGARQITARWLRLPARALSAAMLAGSVVVALSVTAVSVAFTRRPAPLYSPDRGHVAVLSHALQGALGDDYATVAVRESWRPWATIVYSGLGNWDFRANRPGDPEVRWLDSTRLLVRCFDDRSGSEGRGGPARCLSQAGPVRIVCDPIRGSTSTASSR